MAKVKKVALRESIIDKCLQSRRGYSTQEIFDKCNDALVRRGEQPIKSINTIRNDILSIENRWHIIVEQIRIGREIKYRYKNPHFSIFNAPLNEDEITQLSQSVSMLRRFEGMPGFEWMERLSVHLQTTISASPAPVIGFDEDQEQRGMSYFAPLFHAITSQKVLKIKYNTYKDKVIETVIHPYYLKEYNQRWFLLGLSDQYKNISNYALDCIESIERVTTRFIPNKSIDFVHYFDNVIGVSVDPKKEIQTIEIWVDKEQLPYTLSKPIHSSQSVIKEQEDGSAVISIKVIPNFELEQLLLSFGEYMEILSPTFLREKISARIKKNFKKYERVPK